MSRQLVIRLLLAVSLLGTVAACGTSPTGPDSSQNTKAYDDPWPWK